MEIGANASSPPPSSAQSALIRSDNVGIAAAAAILAEGRLLGFPTETVYGLGGDAADPEAVARIYAAKGRPANHPVIVHLPPGGDPLWWAQTLPPDAQALIDAFWPGPLTLIVKRAAHIHPAVSGGQDSVALRCPSHPVAQALLEAFSSLRQGHGGVAGPSANRFGKVSPTSAQHVLDEFGGVVPVLDGGESRVGIESTIIDLSRGFPALLRPGNVTPEQIAEVLGRMPVLPGERTDAHGVAANAVAAAPRASGTLRAHYAPRTPLTLMRAEQIVATLLQRPAGARYAVVLCGPASDAAASISAIGDVELIRAPADPDGYARVLYGLLRALDGAGVEHILFEALPTDAGWRAVNDRLGRAAAAFAPASEDEEDEGGH